MMSAEAGPPIVIEYCGVETPVVRLPFEIGRDADLAVDENPFLHRRFLRLNADDARPELLLLGNIGGQLAATVSDDDTRLEAQLGPGAILPIVFPTTIVRFTAGSTRYELLIHLPGLRSVPELPVSELAGNTTVGRVPFTEDQRLLVLVLAEAALREGGSARTVIPSNAEAARRLGWTITKFNRKLDNVCQRLTKIGVRGLHGAAGDLASNRRTRLVEYALAVGLVTRADLALLDRAAAEAAQA